ncbi:MAG: aminoacyl-tRNA hydrolase [Hyphomicrobiales bacterium]|nr:aminoacyl-tRNA hydrolase [Hyphomicrobiales bacterium]
MKLFVGLGNPGGGYAKHRHNVGFMAADRIAAMHGFGPWRQRFQGDVAEGRLGAEKCLLLKPATYMNESGRSAGEAMRFYKLDLQDVTVFYDELDLAPGKVRVKTGGGAAGHNGIRSLTSHIGADFTRVRIGIGHPGHKDKVQGYVLHDFAKADKEWLEPLLDAIGDAAPKLAGDDAAGFMNAVALKTRSENDDRPSPAEPVTEGTKRADGETEKRTGTSDTGPFARLRSLFGGEK